MIPNFNFFEKQNTKQIVFYKDTCPEIDLYGEDVRKYFLLSHNETMNAIKSDQQEIFTFAISALDMSYLLDKGYRIFLCENSRCAELKEGVTELTDKELRRGHDIRRIWIGGGFEDYFYS